MKKRNASDLRMNPKTPLSAQIMSSAAKASSKRSTPLKMHKTNSLNVSQIVQMNDTCKPNGQQLLQLPSSAKQQIQSHLMQQLNQQQQRQQQHTSSLDRTIKIQTQTQEKTAMLQPNDQNKIDQTKNSADSNFRNMLNLPIGMNLPNGMLQVHQSCDINRINKNLKATILVQSNMGQQSNIAATVTKDHYMQMAKAMPTAAATTARPLIKPNFKLRTPTASPVAPNVMHLHSGKINTNDKCASVGALSISNATSPPMTTQELPQLGKNAITSAVAAGKTVTFTTATCQTILAQDKCDNIIRIHENRIMKTTTPTVQIANKPINTNLTFNSTVTPNITTKPLNSPNIQLQQTNQIIMTSSGQILVMPQQTTKTTNPMIITSQGSNTNTIVVNTSATPHANVMLNTTQAQRQHIISNDLLQSMCDGSVATAGTSHSNATNNVLIQNSNVIASNQNILHSPNSVLSTNNGNVLSNAQSNYIVSSPNAIQSTMLINNSNFLSHNGNVLQSHSTNQNVLANNANNILATATSAKVLSNAGNIHLGSPNLLTNSAPNVITANGQFIGGNGAGALLSPNSGGIVLNQLPNTTSYMIQPQSFTTAVDRPMINVINADNGQFIQQQQQQHRIIVSPASKRRIKKRKNSLASPTQSVTTQLSPTIQIPEQQPLHQQTSLVQISPQYHQQSQSFQPSLEVNRMINHLYNHKIFTSFTQLSHPISYSNKFFYRTGKPYYSL